MGSAEGLVCRRGDHSGGRHLTVSGSAMCQHADRVASSAAGNGDMYRCLCASRSRLRGVRRQLGAFGAPGSAFRYPDSPWSRHRYDFRLVRLITCFPGSVRDSVGRRSSPILIEP
ncbi:hypothetical protein Bbelb_420890 [Branchiostoma belcheri]|nr:hypothetical protein Bbelb_420890 [Branchiostoma belcheri]